MKCRIFYECCTIVTSSYHKSRQKLVAKRKPILSSPHNLKLATTNYLLANVLIVELCCSKKQGLHKANVGSTLANQITYEFTIHRLLIRLLTENFHANYGFQLKATPIIHVLHTVSNVTISG